MYSYTVYSSFDINHLVHVQCTMYIKLRLLFSWSCKLYSVHTTLSVYKLHCTVYILHCTVYILHCTVYILHCAVYILHCTVCILHCTVYIQHCTVYILHCTVYIQHCTVYIQHCTVNILYNTVYIQCTYSRFCNYLVQHNIINFQLGKNLFLTNL